MRRIILYILLGAPLLARGGQVDLEAIRQKYDLPALGSTLINEGGAISNVVGIRKWGTPTPVQLDDKFHLGSCTKAMTATLIAIYVERGLLKWDAKLSDLFPELRPGMHPDFQNVPLEWLTSMHSGIAASFSKELEIKLWDPSLNPSKGRELVARETLCSPPADLPGTKYVYSNTNYVIAGAVLEKISGKTWETLMKEELFERLRMGSCGFGAQADSKLIAPNEPWPHRFASGIPVPVTPDFFGDNPPTLGPAGTVHCSMGDWAKFIRLHLDGAKGRDTALLKAGGFKKLHASYPDKKYTYGGWSRIDQAGKFALAHVGSNGMNVADVWIFPNASLAALSVTNVARGGSAASHDDPAFKATDEVIAALIR